MIYYYLDLSFLSAQESCEQSMKRPNKWKKGKKEKGKENEKNAPKMEK